MTSRKALQDSKDLIASYKLGKIAQMTPELWHAKKVVDSTIHPGALVDGFLTALGKMLTFHRYW